MLLTFLPTKMKILKLNFFLSLLFHFFFPERRDPSFRPFLVRSSASDHPRPPQQPHCPVTRHHGRRTGASERALGVPRRGKWSWNFLGDPFFNRRKDKDALQRREPEFLGRLTAASGCRAPRLRSGAFDEQAASLWELFLSNKREEAAAAGVEGRLFFFSPLFSLFAFFSFSKNKISTKKQLTQVKKN